MMSIEKENEVRKEEISLKRKKRFFFKLRCIVKDMEIHDERERNSPRTHKIFMSPWLVSTFLEEISHGLSHTK